MLADADDSSTVWRLPFNLYDGSRGCCCSLLAILEGMCVQGNNSGDTHVKELAWAFDFSLSVGTPVLASADGVVAAAVSCFESGSRANKEMRARANFVALRHAPGVYTRYYHLRFNGVKVNVGDHVVAGQIIGFSGNTGFSSGPHLHWDVVDVLPTETATLRLRDVHGKEQPFESVAACFSARLPACDAELTGRAVWADPPTASETLRDGEALLQGAVVIVERCKHVDFVDKARRAEAAGARAVVVVNYRDAGPGTLTMGLPVAEKKRCFTVGIPALMVAYDAGEAIRAALGAAAKVGSPPSVTQLAIGRSKHLVARSEVNRSAADADPPISDYVPNSLPARFLWPGHADGYLPSSGCRPPREVQCAGVSESMVYSATASDASRLVVSKYTSSTAMTEDGTGAPAPSSLAPTGDGPAAGGRAATVRSPSDSMAPAYENVSEGV